MGSAFGNKVKISIYGESHGEAIGCVIDGLPHGLKIDFNKIKVQMRRRAPGNDKTATPRKEKDEPIILSGVFDGYTTGAPLAMMIKNENTKSSDYSNLKKVLRPSHSDYPAYIKYDGFNDVRGGGHFSGRLTAPIVFAGAIARQILEEKGIFIGAHIKRIGSICDTPFNFNSIPVDLLNKLSTSNFSVIDDKVEEIMRAEVEKYRLAQNSVGGEIECAVVGMPVGVGSNIFDTVESKISSAMFAIPAVKGVAFGLGFDFAKENGMYANDCYQVKDGKVSLTSNNNGGVLGGMTTGAPVVFSVAVKPTASVSQPQKSVNIESMENEILEIHGRHDPCIVPRAVSVVESATALAILDLL